jgi:hypothetical protein
MLIAPASEKLFKLLPKLKKFSARLITDTDLIVHAPGFEDRTFAIIDGLASDIRANAILIDYVPNNPDNRLAAVRQGLAAKGVKVTEQDIITYNHFEPGDFEERLSIRIRHLKAHRIVIDISTMSKLLIMLTLNVARDLKLDVIVFYAEPLAYRPTEEDFQHARAESKVHQPSLQVFTGVHGVVRVDSLASVAMQGHQTAALVFMSFNDALTQVLLNTVYPGRLLLINGRPPRHRWREKATAWIHDQVRREWEEDNPVSDTKPGDVALPRRTVSTLDYRETVMLLLDLYWELSATQRILLAPAGSKLQTIGCFLIKSLHPDIHIEYPSPEGFAPDYSTGVGRRWTLDLGNLARWLKAIGNAERQEHLEISSSKIRA